MEYNWCEHSFMYGVMTSCSVDTLGPGRHLQSQVQIHLPYIGLLEADPLSLPEALEGGLHGEGSLGGGSNWGRVCNGAEKMLALWGSPDLRTWPSQGPIRPSTLCLATQLLTQCWPLLWTLRPLGKVLLVAAPWPPTAGWKAGRRVAGRLNITPRWAKKSFRPYWIIVFIELYKFGGRPWAIATRSHGSLYGVIRPIYPALNEVLMEEMEEEGAEAIKQILVTQEINRQGQERKITSEQTTGGWKIQRCQEPMCPGHSQLDCLLASLPG